MPLDLHHICKPGKVDEWSNVIRVCRSVHGFDDNHPREMAVVSLWHKMKKGEFDIDELDRCVNGTFAGFLDRQRPGIDVFIPLWEELVELVAAKEPK